MALADMPFIQPSTHRAIAAALRAGASLAAPQYQGRRGHPVGFAGEWLEALSALSGDHGGRDILGVHRAQLVLQPVDDPGVLMDVDRPEQLPAGAQAAPSTD
ncbi:MAG: NTP transferase domain-containing protein [Gammaproteobacteria bacterium]